MLRILNLILLINKRNFYLQFKFKKMSNKRLLKNFIRVDGNGRMISSSNIWRQKMSKVGKWVEIDGYLCCNTITTSTTMILT